MLNRWRKNRQRRGAAGRLPDGRQPGARRLGFEAMEGRLMLSGDMPEFVAWDPVSSPSGLAVYDLQFALLQANQPKVEILEGGFIQPSLTLGSSSSDAALEAFAAHFYKLSIHPNSASLRDGSSISDGWNRLNAGGTNVDFSEVYFDTPAIPVLVVPPADSDVGATFSDPLPLDGPLPAEVTTNEGGAIPIKSILAFVGRGDGWKSTEQLAKTTPSQAGDLLVAPTVAHPTKVREVSGEWARPSMLEMAGGEPASVRQAATARQDLTPMQEDSDDLRLRGRLSSAASFTPADELNAHRGADRSNTTAEAISVADAAAANSRSSTTAGQHTALFLASLGADVASQALLATNQSSESPDRDDSAASEDGALDTSAVAQVYDELGMSGADATQASLHGEGWQHSWKATPLLMILALERIAASNSRRAKKEPRVDPRLSQSR